MSPVYIISVSLEREYTGDGRACVVKGLVLCPEAVGFELELKVGRTLELHLRIGLDAFVFNVIR